MLSLNIGALNVKYPKNKLISLTVLQEHNKTICGVITMSLDSSTRPNVRGFKSIGKCPSGDELFTI